MKGMAAAVAYAVIGLAVIAAGAEAMSSAASGESPPYEVAELQGFLFYNDTGGFSRNIPETAPLWNSIIGEGWAGRSSNATLVRAVVTGAPGSYEPKRHLRFIVQSGVYMASGAFRW